MNQRVLFVDDEPKLLEGLGRMLRGQRHEWAMEFVPGGVKALEKLALAPFDVIVSDMRMPEMDGAQLLAEVREHYPHVVRIVLSGQCDKEAFLRLAGVAHRHLAKPCDPMALRETVKRAGQLRAILANDTLRAMVSRLESVPSRPSSYLAAAEELERARPSVAKVAALMTQDMGMTAKILQLASSVFFGARSPIANPEQAALILGCDVLKALMQVPRAFSKFDPVNLQPLSIDAVWRHSLATSTLARRIAAEQGCDAGAIDCAFVAGMLHDVGILVLAQYLPASCQEVWELTRQDPVAVGDAERAVFGTSHAEIGAYLLGLWGLDPAIVDAVAWHHRPRESAAATFTPLTAVHVADALAREVKSQESGDRSQRSGVRDPLSPESCPLTPAGAACLGGLGEKIDETYLARIGVTERLPFWRELAQEVSKDFNER